MKQKPTNNSRDQKGKNPTLKMKDLTEATGISKATILYYVNAGLLPKPVKTSPNVAFYPFQTIERINFIKQLQSKHRLSLAQIKMILKERDKGREVAPLIEMSEFIFGKADNIKMNKKEFCEAAGLSPSALKKAIAAQVVVPREDGCFDSEDLAVGRMLSQNNELGITAEDLAFYPLMAKKIVEKEIAIQEHLTGNETYEDALAITLDLTRNARILRSYIIDRIFQKEITRQKLSFNKKKLKKAK